jgi:hypothetical protein
VVTGLNLEVGATYYFTVKATNNAGLTSETGLSDGIRIDPTFQPDIKVIPSAPQSTTEFSGIALYAPSAMSVVLKAMDPGGRLVSGTGVRNPTTVTLNGGQQYAKLISEIFGIEAFDGWIQVEASATGLGISTVTGSREMTRLDGYVPRAVSTDFFLFHSGALAALVNPSTRIANVTINGQSLTIPAGNRIVTSVPGIVRVQSSEALAALEAWSPVGKLALSSAVPRSDAQSSLIFSHAVTGGGYRSTLSLANVTAQAQEVTIAYGTSVGTLRLEANSTSRFSIAEFLQQPSMTMTSGALRVSAPGIFGNSPSLVGLLDIENETGLVTIAARPAAMSIVFPHVAHGNDLFTGLAFATGDVGAAITLDVYDSAGSIPKTATISLGANQQRAGLINEFVTSVNIQQGGYIRIRSDQPIWAWEIYGSGDVMASGPPL